ncbi:hypothetical protein FE257_010309 [Aspergillus nanangensis]|uniref:Acetyl-CoA synthetase-like protein n=1 Tax=Aspergillus nanangensis TaxID=2582783 RepID=A0AAD4CIS0_ASPNN|nr:hypothetical protein FE257_010309 [Aspergillus nanangensis]
MGHKFSRQKASENECPNIGQRLLLNFIDGIASEEPDKPAVHQLLAPKDDEGQNETEIILSYGDVANLINQLAWWLTKNGVKGKESAAPIAYLGPSDLRHLLIALAGVRIGMRVLLLSPRNSVPMNEFLLQESQCSLLLYDFTFAKMTHEITCKRRIELLLLEDLEDIMKNMRKVNPYPYRQTWKSAYSKPIVILHTTGSTGNPKPVPISHAALAAIDAQRRISQKNRGGRKCQLEIVADARIAYVGFPLFHVAGFALSCYLLFTGCTLLLGYPRRPPGIPVLRAALQVPNVDGALLPPSIVDELTEDSELLKKISRLRWIVSGGGAISQSAGDIVATKTRLMNGIGSTECGSFIQYATDPSHWNYCHFHPKNGIIWRPVSSDQENDEFELVLQRDDCCLPYQAVFHNFPQLQEWSTKDVFKKHPSLDDHWAYQYRLDDLIVFSTGEKMNPMPVEARLRNIPGIQEMLVIGNRQSYPALLLEINACSQDKKDNHLLPPSTRGAIKEVLEMENSRGSRDAQINDKTIIVASPDKPFVRTGKGSIHRNKTLQLYESEIEELYRSTRFSKPLNYYHTPLDLSSEEALAFSLAELVDNLGSGSGRSDVDRDIFATGVDSKKAQILAYLVKRALMSRTGGEDAGAIFSVETAYNNPTPTMMARSIMRQLSRHEKEGQDFEEFYTLLQRYSESLPGRSTGMQINTLENKKRHILFTGSTGFVGSYVLDALMHRRQVARVTCLNRETRPPSTQYLIDETESSAVCVENLPADLAKENLGLSIATYNGLLASVTDVLHCQWAVDFNRPLTHFEPHMKGVQNLIQFSHDSKHNAHIVFLSSVATVKNWNKDTPVPEEPLESPQHAETGYGQSKLLASMLLDQACKSAKIRASICRLGQVTGPVVTDWREGRDRPWPHRDWFPTLLSSSIDLGYLPDSLGPADQVDWVPVDTVTGLLCDLICDARAPDTQNEDPLSRYYHIVNPRRVHYSQLVPFLAERLKLSIVPLTEWVAMLAEKGLQSQNSQEQPVPGIQLLGFFQGLANASRQVSVILDTKVTEEKFSRLKAVPAVNQAWIDMWLDQGKF